MSGRFFIAAAAAVFASTAVGTASAAEYLFVFDPFDASFTAERADNRASLAAAAALLADYGAAEGVHFLLVGDLPAECIAAADCAARSLQQRRVESIKTQLAALPDGARWVRQLQWQPIPLAPEQSHVEGLRLRLRVDPASVFSGQCPYELQVTDPRLPTQLAPAGEEPKTWISVSGLSAVAVSGAASVRVTPAVRNSGAVSAFQRVDNHDALLSSGTEEVQWSAGQLNWSADAADVDIDGASQPRDVGNVILPWDENPAPLPSGASSSSGGGTTLTAATPPSGAAASGTCHVHFVLRR